MMSNLPYRRLVDQVGQWLDELLGEPGLEGGERGEELDDLDPHPIVLRRGQQPEEDRGERQVVLGVLPGELADHVDRAGLDGGLSVIEFVLEARKRWAERVRELQKNLVEYQRSLLPDIGPG